MLRCPTFSSDLTDVAISPFTMLSLEDSADRQLRRSQLFSQTVVSSVSELIKFSGPTSKHKDRKIKLGYFSSDFRDHPFFIC